MNAELPSRPNIIPHLQSPRSRQNSIWSELSAEELISSDPRPSIVVDLHRKALQATAAIVYRNAAWEDGYDFDHEVAVEFRQWAFTASDDPRTQSGDYSYTWRGLAWTSITLRKRWKVISGNNTTSTSGGKSPQRDSFYKNSGDHSPRPLPLRTLQPGPEAIINPTHDWTRAPPSTRFAPYVRFLRTWDWSKTPLGPIEKWSSQLRLMANLITIDPNPAVFFWGPEMAGIYNEPYIAMLNDKHPKALGEKFQDTWAEIYAIPESAAALDAVWEKGRNLGEATRQEHQTYFLLNGSRLEERIFHISLIPIIGDGGNTVGFYEPLIEITGDHLTTRRLNTLTRLTEVTAGEGDLHVFFRRIIEALEGNIHDVTFAFMYSITQNDGLDRVSHDGQLEFDDIGAISLEGYLGVRILDGQPTAHELLMSDMQFMSTFKAVCITGRPQLFDLTEHTELTKSLTEEVRRRGHGDLPQSAVLCPIQPTTHRSTPAILVLGINPRRPYDADYQNFVQGLSRTISSSLASVLLVNEQRRLAQIESEKREDAEQSEQLAKSILAMSPVGCFLMTMDGEMQYVNDAWYAITEYSFTDHHPMSWLSVIAKEDLPLMDREWKKLVEDRIAVSFELRLKRHWESIDPVTGENISGPAYILAAAAPKAFPDNTYITGCITDISRQKWAERRQKEQRDEAVELKRQQENFIDMTSHEMRNPLSAILQCADGIVSVLSSFQTAPEPPQVPAGRPSVNSRSTSNVSIEDPISYAIDAASTIILCSQHQKRIVDDVLVLSKADANLLEVAPIETQPKVLVENALKMFEAELLANESQMTLIADESYDALGVDWVKLDPGRLMQVLINLCTNAIKFTVNSVTRHINLTIGASIEKPTGTKGDIEYLEAPLDTKLKDPTSRAEWGIGEILYLNFQVKDTGGGISEEEMKLLFQRFHQASPRTHIQYGGSGLGLFIARLLTQLQGGDIGVTSTLSEGSTFAFYIKVRRAEPPASHCESAAFAPRSLPNLTPAPDSNVDPIERGMVKSPPILQAAAAYSILVVEDNVVNQKVLGRQLRNLGYAVYIANHGHEAVEFLRETRFWKHGGQDAKELTLVLMDIEMPIMNGTEATKYIRRLETEGELVAHVPIIAITANARMEQVAIARDSGMDDVVSKPFRIPELLAKIEALVGPPS